MGNDPSKGGQKAPGGTAGRVDPPGGAKEGEVPYTSYSVDRSKQSQVKDIRSQNATDIITVVEVNSGPRSNLEPELQALDRIATFEPLVKQTGWPFGASNKPGPEMDPQALLKLCGEYQSFCRKIASVVSQQQTVLCARMRAKEGHALEASRALQKHLQDVRQFELMFRDVEKIHLQINTTRLLLTQVIAKTEEVCSQLPQKYQLSPIRSFVEDRSQLPLIKGEEGEQRRAQQSEGDEQDEYEEEREAYTTQDGDGDDASGGGGSVAAREEDAESDESQLATEPKEVETAEEEAKKEGEEAGFAVPDEAETEPTAPEAEKGLAEASTTAETAQEVTPPEGADGSAQ